MISKELQKKIELIRLTAGKKVTESFSGNFESAFKGQGIEFDEVKEYIPGDDYRAIDWNVTARTGVPHIKRYIEERELSVLFAVDISASVGFKTLGKSKLDMTAELVAALTLAATRTNDKTGLLLFSDKIEKFIPPSKGGQHTMRLIREILGTPSSSGATDIGSALNYITEITGKKWIVFLISDFYDFDEGWMKLYRTMQRRFDMIPIRPVVEADYTLPDAGMITLSDPETGKRITVDSSSRSVRRKFKDNFDEYEAFIKKEFTRSGTTFLRTDMDKDWTRQLIKYFFERESRRGA